MWIQWSSLVRCDAAHRSSQLLSTVHGKAHTYSVSSFPYLLFVLRPKQENPVCRLLDNERNKPFLLSLLYLFFTCLSHLLNRLGAFPDQSLIYITWSSVKYWLITIILSHMLPVFLNCQLWPVLKPCSRKHLESSMRMELLWIPKSQYQTLSGSTFWYPVATNFDRHELHFQEPSRVQQYSNKWARFLIATYRKWTRDIACRTSAVQKKQTKIGVSYFCFPNYTR